VTPPHTDESNIGVWLWLVLVVVVNALWVGMDMWLHRHGHEYLTVEVREALQAKGAWGLVISCAVGATLGLAAYHFIYQRGV